MLKCLLTINWPRCEESQQNDNRIHQNACSKKPFLIPEKALAVPLFLSIFFQTENALPGVLLNKMLVPRHEVPDNIATKQLILAISISKKLYLKEFGF